MNPKDICLVMAPMWDSASPQLGLPLIKAYLQASGYSVSVYDFAIRLLRASTGEGRAALENMDMGLLGRPERVQDLFDAHADLVERSLDEMLATGARVFGFTLYMSNRVAVLELAARLKKRDPSRLVVLGGPECVRFKGAYYQPRDRANFAVADALVPGEGELALKGLLEGLRPEGFSATPGAYVKILGEFVWGGEGEAVKDLDSLPFPDFSDHDLALYSKPDHLVTYMTRGCVRHCTFCDVEFYWGGYRSRSGKRVFEEISHQMKAHPGTRFFWFCDSIINADIRQLEDFCDRVLDARAKGFPWFGWNAYAIVRREMTPALTRKMQLAGCSHLYIGIESGSQRVLDAMKKNALVSVAEDTLRNVHEAGIHTQALMMVGFPTETEEDFQESLAFMSRVAPYVSQADPSDATTYIGPGTALYEQAFTAHNIDPDSFHSEYWRTRDDSNTYPLRLQRFERFCAEMTRLKIAMPSNKEALAASSAQKLADYERFRATLTGASRAGAFY